MADGPDLSLLRQRIREIERRLDGAGTALPAETEPRVAQLEREVAAIAALLARVEPMIARIDATVPGLASKVELERMRAQVAAQLGEKPSRASLWALVALLLVVLVAPRVAGLLP
ncbi:hypothetical protein FK498_13495 [Elioraea sp. Yellowstone]|jgi:hypothetical protein|uniref:hypothetical protein n=1 Tax=Elioraea sp. Yellowstone TaxID=2592070 RepID=UPI001151FCBF|nr:hypothetical protein [Elioraea sp. Yellowstone]TQF77260.1 hypothetical protein FK498_13495 [Elioraea sp. Yellowstone]